MTEGKIASAFKEKGSIALVSHVMPDGDSIGSMLALYCYLKHMGKDVEVFSSDAVPSVYSFLPFVNAVNTGCDSVSKKYDILAVLDCGDMDRTGACWTLKDNSEVIINIDHHATNSQFGHINLVDTNASSTGELVYRIMMNMGAEISGDEASCLYTAILTDTGCFRYSNTTPDTHRIVGELLKTKMDFGSIHDAIYNSFKYEDVKMLGKAVSTVELMSGGRIAFMYLLKNDMGSLRLDEINTSDFINYARDINGVEAAVFAKEVNEGEFKVSLRSKHCIDVRTVCEKFGGGGHVRAAGCTIKGSISDVKSTIISELEKALKGEDIWMEY